MANELKVNRGAQTMGLYENDLLINEYVISTAKNGFGEQLGSECTPRGRHQIRAKIGAGCKLNTVFVSRRPTGEVYQLGMCKAEPERDWILTRILWLSGLESGFNRGGEVDTMRRYVYIHGCPDDSPIGIPYSKGCIRMRNADLVELFDIVSVGTKIYI